MKKLIAAIAFSVFLAGCNTQGTPTMEPGVAKFYSDVEAAGFTIESRPDVLTVGEKVCDAMQDYTTEDIAFELMSIAPQVFISYEDTKLFISAAVTNVCATHNKSKGTS